MRGIKALAVIGCACSLLGSAPSLAVPVLRLTDGVNTITITDQGGGDLNPDVGVVTFIGAIGVWNINVSTGISFPRIGFAPPTLIDLNSINVSTGAGTLTVLFGDTDFSLGAGAQAFDLTSAIGGTTAGTVRWQPRVSDANNNPVTGGFDQVGLFRGPLGPGAFSQTNTDPFLVDGTFGLALLVQIVHTGSGVSSFDYEGQVPEPASLLLIGAGLLGIAALRRRRKD